MPTTDRFGRKLVWKKNIRNGVFNTLQIALSVLYKYAGKHVTLQGKRFAYDLFIV